MFELEDKFEAAKFDKEILLQVRVVARVLRELANGFLHVMNLL